MSRSRSVLKGRFDLVDTAICTMFEKDYHYGLAALVNSLFHHGYRGIIWAGYRGNLPPWAKTLTKHDKYSEFPVAKDCSIRFVALPTSAHLTNYKPDFLIDLLENYCPEITNIFYFDPDIVIKCGWSFFEEWVGCGICLCEDVNSPCYDTHPLREAWRRYYAPHGFTFPLRTDVYANGGFIGISRSNQHFLHTWMRIQSLMEPAIGGLQNVNVKDRTFLFHKTDQDALNVAVMCSAATVSFLGQEGMDFMPGGYTMSHALGAPKPWSKSMIAQALNGKSPSLADRGYLKNANDPIRPYSKLTILWKKFDTFAAACIGRLTARR